MGGIVSGGAAAVRHLGVEAGSPGSGFTPTTPKGKKQGAEQISVKELGEYCSSPWQPARLELRRSGTGGSGGGGGGGGGTPTAWGDFSPTRRRAGAQGFLLFVGGSTEPLVLLKKSTGAAGGFDTVQHLDEVRTTSGAAKTLALDTTGDERPDLLLVDSDADGEYDKVYRFEQAPLSFLTAYASEGYTPSMPRVRSPMKRPKTGEASASDDDGMRLRAAASGDSDARPLAAGWERVWSKSQGTYYYCHGASRRTTWSYAEAAGQSPTEAGVEGEDVRPLAAGWEVVRSKTTDGIYYYHAATRRTTWDANEARIGYPSYWRHLEDRSKFLDLVHHDEPDFRQVQMLLASTFLTIRTRDRQSRLPLALEAVRIWRIENSEVWRKYATCRATVEASTTSRLEPIDPLPKTQELMPQKLKSTFHEGLNEVLLFHGSTAVGASRIACGGFDVRKASGKSCYGPGLYFSECSSKSDEYAVEEEAGAHRGLCAMLLCRVTLGSVLNWPHAEVNEEFKLWWASQKYNSILGDRQQLRGTYREFVLPPDFAGAAYPEFLILYRRVFDD